MPTQEKVRECYLLVFIAGQDDIIDPLQNMEWLASHEKGDMDIRWRNTLDYRIPLDVFKEELIGFFGYKF